MDNQNQEKTTTVKIRRTDKERMAQSVKSRQEKGYRSFSMMISPSLHSMFEAIAEEKGLQKKQVIEQYIKNEYKNLHAA